MKLGFWAFGKVPFSLPILSNDVGLHLEKQLNDLGMCVWLTNVVSM